MNQQGAGQLVEAVSEQPSLLQVQRQALRRLYDAAHQADQADHTQQTGYRARKSWIERRDQRVQERIAARARQLAQINAECESALEAFIQGQHDQLRADEHEARDLREQTHRRHEHELNHLRQDVANSRTAAVKVLEDQQNHHAAWLKRRHQEDDACHSQLTLLRQQAADRVLTFPRIMRSSSDKSPAEITIETPDEEQASKVQIDRFMEQSVLAVRRLHELTLPHAFFGVEPYLWSVLVLFAGAGSGYAAMKIWPAWKVSTGMAVLSGMAAALGLILLTGLTLFQLARRRVRVYSARAEAAFSALDRAIEHDRQLARSLHDEQVAAAQQTCDEKTRKIDESYAARHKKIERKGKDAVVKLEQVIKEQRQTRAAAQVKELAAFKRDSEQRRKRLADCLALRREVAQRRTGRDMGRLETMFHNAQSALLDGWTAGRDQVLAELEPSQQLDAAHNQPWSDPAWPDWTPSPKPAAAARFGQLAIASDCLLDPQQRGGQFDLGWPPHYAIPAILAGPGERSLLIQTDPLGREPALDAVRSAMMRLLTTLPPGQVKFTLIDPVGLGQTFAGFMHLADYDESLVNTRIWSEPAQIEQRLADLTDHLSYVIQKHLRNRFEHIDAYNLQAGELAEPYHFVVVADYPQGLTPTAIARLNSIAASGPRCGVYVLAVQDVRQRLPSDAESDLAARCTTIQQVQQQNGDAPPRYVWRDEVFSRFALTLDKPPSDELMRELIDRVGRQAVSASRVQLPFATIAPSADKLWFKSSSHDLSVPIGKAGATRLQPMTFGVGVAQHALIAGKTGSGKSSLLHALVTNLALWYSPDELELYLVDFKRGVEFKPYVTHRIPHLRAVAIESDRAFGLSILKKLDAQMDERGEKFRKTGVHDIASYRAARPDDRMPRTLLIVDEFQELFAADDQIALTAATLLDRLVRQGRAFGMHAIMGTQSLSGAAGLALGTASQMAVRVALMCGEADSQLILGEDNTAARLLSRPGEAIYNEQGGAATANIFFQVAWLPGELHKQQLDRVAQHHESRGGRAVQCAVFEGSLPADISANIPLAAALTHPAAADDHEPARAYLGEPIAIEPPAAFELPRISGANGLIIGPRAESALAITFSGVLSLAAQLPPDRARFVIINGSPEPEHARQFEHWPQLMPNRCDLVAWRQISSAIAELHELMQQRTQDSASYPQPSVFLIVFALHRLRDLRKREEEISFNFDADKDSSLPGAGAVVPGADKMFVELLHDGPAVGIHTIAWCDRAAALDQMFDRRDLRAFDQRVLFQMSATDSATLIDSADANQLGPFRALLYREDRGTQRIIRPYGPPEAAWLERFAQTLRNRSQTAGG
ncbi:MAG: hypothetical protein IT445_09320 [Phycisphaeraceae bacterium]|nr:hypothetical protein [Phycisphaeraceae bacterium]